MAHKSLKEKILYVLYICFAKNLPQSDHCKPAKKIRMIFAKSIMNSVGKNVNIERGAIFCGDCSIGDYSGIGINCELNGPVKIGKYVSMGPEVVFYTENHSFGRTDIPIQQQGFDETEPIVVGDDVWIGRRALILPGVHIGRGCVIGAGAIISKDVPDYAVVVGNPGKVIRIRKSD